jgi:hypothetical protein
MIINQGDVFWVDLDETSGLEPAYRHLHFDSHSRTRLLLINRFGI